MIDQIGTMMVRKRVAELEAESDALLLAMRRTRREKLLAAARNNPKPSVAGGMATWFRGRRTITTG